MMYPLVTELAGDGIPVTVACGVLKLARAPYYRWLAHPVTDAELVELDRWIRAHSIERYGPVRAVEPRLVLEIAFDAVQKSSRHKSGIAMRFPRVHRIRWDKPAAEADTVENLIHIIEAQ